MQTKIRIISISVSPSMTQETVSIYNVTAQPVVEENDPIWTSPQMNSLNFSLKDITGLEVGEYYNLSITTAE